MKTRWITALIVGLAALGLSATAAAETKVVKKKPQMRKVGIGTALSASTGLAPVAIYVPINITKQFRIEPEIGWTITSNDATAGGNTTTTTTNAYRAGIGAFFLNKLGATTRLYVGGRVTALMLSTDDGDKTTTTHTHTNIAGVLGAEHFFTMRFSLGAEAQANITMLGEGEADVDGTTDKMGDAGSIISSNTLLMARWYF